MDLSKLFKFFSRTKTTPSRHSQPFINYSPMQAGMRVNEDTALTYSAVWACVSYISGSIAGLPWHEFEKEGDKNKKRLYSPIDWMLSTSPNPEMSAFSFKETIIAHALLWGNGIAEIERDMSGRPVGLWPIEPNRVAIDRDENNRLVYEVTNEGREKIRLLPQDVFHLHGLGFNGLAGYSVISYAGRSVGLGMASEEFGAAFYKNGTQMGLTLEHPGKLSTTAKENLINSINDKLKGPQKAFSAMVFEEGMKATAIGMPLKDAEYLDSRKFQTTEIARWFGVPPHKIGDMDKATFSNIEHQGIEAVQDCLMPWVVRLEQEADRKLSKNHGRRFSKMNMNSLLRGDSASRGEFYRTMHSIGVLSTNDILELEDRNTIGPEGDKRLVQLNQTTLDKIGEEEIAEENTEPVVDFFRNRIKDSFKCIIKTEKRKIGLLKKEHSNRDEFVVAVRELLPSNKEFLMDKLIEDAFGIHSAIAGKNRHKLDDIVGDFIDRHNEDIYDEIIDGKLGARDSATIANEFVDRIAISAHYYRGVKDEE